ncbi:MAG: TerB family tellurite resistance protein [Planctomycetota bacterium]|nr:TerB family tellurite resistance protein [Planctomycetota bacterium]
MTVQALEHEALASMRVAARVAEADGVLHERERSSLRRMLDGSAVPQDFTLEWCLHPAESLDTLLEEIHSPEMRQRTYEMACLVAQADGRFSDAELALLKRIRERFGLRDDPEALSHQLKLKAKELAHEARLTVIPGQIHHVVNWEERQLEIDRVILKYGLLAAAIGSFPVPLMDMAMNASLVVLQTKMIHDLGQIHGVASTDEQIRDAFAGLGLGTGLRAIVIGLMKFIPVWGSVAGCLTGFATTYALGKVASRYFESDGRVSQEELKQLFEAEQRRAREIYDRNKVKFAQRVEDQRKHFKSLVGKLFKRDP